MNEKDLAEQQIKELRAKIEALNTAYYDKDDPLVSDAVYDNLTVQLRQLETKFPDLITETSPTQHIGGHPSSSFRDVKHIVPLQSLRDVFNTSDVQKWIDNTAVPPYSVETKVDGLSCALTYQDGILIRAATRGDGFIGEDVTENARQINNIPETLYNVPGKLIVRCEIYMPVSAFETLNESMKKAGKPLFKNPRNAAAGSLRNKNPQTTKERGLAAAAFAIMFHDKFIPGLDDQQTPESQTTALYWLENHGFQVVKHALCRNADEVFNAIQQIDAERNNHPYAIDGAAIKEDNNGLWSPIGSTAKYAANAIAYKYPPIQKQTILQDIILQTGRTGVITPVAVFKPIILAGTTVTKATLHNQEFMDNILGGITPGDRIIVHKSGEIIPEVLKVLHDQRPQGRSDFKITHCPVCGARAILGADENDNGTQMYCINPDCPAILEGRMIYWCSKHVMDIDGIGPKITRALLDTGLKRIEDLYRLTNNFLASIPEIGPVRAPKILQNIHNSKTRDIDRLIAGLGIPGVGRHIGKQLAAQYPDMQSIETAALQGDLIHIEGIGPTTSNDISLFFQNKENIRFLRNLKAAGLNMQSLQYKNQASSLPLTGMTFVITGSFQEKSRDEMRAYLENLGAKTSGSLSKKTSYLLVGANPGSKLTEAEKRGIPTLHEDDLKNLINQSAKT